MALSKEIAPNLPFLRRYGRALLGDDPSAVDLVSAMLESIASNPKALPRGKKLRVGLFRALHVESLRFPAPDLPSGGSATSNEGQIAYGRLAPLRPMARRALLLSAMEGLDLAEVAFVLDVPEADASELIDEALAQIHSQMIARILIVEDEPIIAMDLETIVRDLGHDVVAVATTRDEALAFARAHSPNLVLMDIQLADDSSGIDAAEDILAELKVPIIFITAFPERLLTGRRPEPTYLITKPFRRSTVKAAVTQAMFFETSTVPTAETLPAPPNSKAALIPSDLTRPHLGPVDARVVNGQLRLVDRTSAEPLPDSASVEAARQVHYRTVRRLCENLEGSNVGPGFTARLTAVRRVLSRKLSRERSLQLALEVRGLSAMMGAISERLDNVTVADVAVFVDDLDELIRQFPHYRQFVDEALAFEPIGPESRGAAAELAIFLETLPSELVEPSLKQAIRDVRQSVEDQRDPVAGLGLLRTVGNVFRAIGRAFNRRLAGVSKKAAEEFDLRAGKAIGRGLVYVVLAPVVGLGLGALYAAFPGEFAFFVHLLKVARSLL